jgi:hypothetical protein
MLPRIVLLVGSLSAGIAHSVLLPERVRGEEVIVQLPARPGPLDNPLKGWCPYPNAGNIRQPYSMVFQYISWRELEPVEGQFRFEEWEQTWNTEAAAGKHIIFRVYIDYPKKPSGLPEWLRAAGVRETAYTDYGGGLSPDYNDPRMLAGMERLIAALGKRYNADPRVAFIQLGLLGFWGEWHTYPQTRLYASPETEQWVIDAYRRAFPDKSLMVRYARGHAGEQDWIGFHDDMFPEDTDNGKDWSFLAGLRKTGRSDNWRVAVIGGEMVPGQAQQWLGREWETTLSRAERAHFTWVGPYCPALDRSRDEQFLRNSEALVRRMGYEYRLTELRHAVQVQTAQPLQLNLSGVNQGVAPFYYPWSVEWALIDAAGKVVQLEKTDWDIRQWQPGEFSAEWAFVPSVPAGVYRLGLGIRDPWQDRPAIRFANDLPVLAGWTVLGEIRVTE